MRCTRCIAEPFGLSDQAIIAEDNDTDAAVLPWRLFLSYLLGD